ncbi:MAG: hypothetical protein GX633_01560 [Clostridiales bacterium]|nr:hypothetical protein [Clostridiales bacterium]
MRTREDILKGIQFPEDRLCVTHMLDRLRMCRERYIITSCGFYTAHERAVLESALRGCDVKYVFDGGFEESERAMLIFLPDYCEDITKEELRGNELFPFQPVKITLRYDGRRLSHRDYLGSLMSLGIERAMVGDLSVSDKGCVFPCIKSVTEHILTGIDKVANVGADLARCGFDELSAVETKVKIIRDSAPSLRLDSIVSSAFSLSRSEGKSAIERGLVSVNGSECVSPDRIIPPDTSVTLRGKGKAKLIDASGKTRKGNIAIVIERYV